MPPAPGPLRLGTLVSRGPSPLSASRSGCPPDRHHHRLPHHGHSCSDHNSCLKKLVRILSPSGLQMGGRGSPGGAHRKVLLRTSAPGRSTGDGSRAVQHPAPLGPGTAGGVAGWPAAGAMPAPPWTWPLTWPSLRSARAPGLPALAARTAALPASESFLSDAGEPLDAGHLGHPVDFPPAAWARSEPALRRPRLSRALTLGWPPSSPGRSESAELGHRFAPGSLSGPISSWKLAYFEVGLAGCTHLLYLWENRGELLVTPPACSHSSSRVAASASKLKLPQGKLTQVLPWLPQGPVSESCPRT